MVVIGCRLSEKVSGVSERPASAAAGSRLKDRSVAFRGHVIML